MAVLRIVFVEVPAIAAADYIQGLHERVAAALAKANGLLSVRIGRSIHAACVRVVVMTTWASADAALDTQLCDPNNEYRLWVEHYESVLDEMAA